MDHKAEFDIILSSVLLKVSELMYKGANGDIPEEACRRLQEVMVWLREVDEMLTPKSRKGRKKSADGVVPHRIADKEKEIFVVRCWLMYQAGVFEKKYPADDKDKAASNFKNLMIWLGSCIGEDLSDAEQLLQHALEQRDILNHLQDDQERVTMRKDDMRVKRENKNILRNSRKDREKRKK